MHSSRTMIGIDWAQKDANSKEKTSLKRENKIHSRFKFYLCIIFLAKNARLATQFPGKYQSFLLCGKNHDCWK
jgi:hypothetical protein